MRKFTILLGIMIMMAGVFAECGFRSSNTDCYNEGPGACAWVADEPNIFPDDGTCVSSNTGETCTAAGDPNPSFCGQYDYCSQNPEATDECVVLNEAPTASITNIAVDFAAETVEVTAEITDEGAISTVNFDIYPGTYVSITDGSPDELPAGGSIILSAPSTLADADGGATWIMSIGGCAVATEFSGSVSVAGSNAVCIKDVATGNTKYQLEIITAGDPTTYVRSTYDVGQRIDQVQLIDFVGGPTIQTLSLAGQPAAWYLVSIFANDGELSAVETDDVAFANSIHVAPVLSECGISPPTGDEVQSFEFSAIYQSDSNINPGIIEATLTNGESYSFDLMCTGNALQGAICTGSNQLENVPTLPLPADTYSVEITAVDEEGLDATPLVCDPLTVTAAVEPPCTITISNVVIDAGSGGNTDISWDVDNAAYGEAYFRPDGEDEYTVNVGGTVGPDTSFLLQFSLTTDNSWHDYEIRSYADGCYLATQTGTFLTPMGETDCFTDVEFCAANPGMCPAGLAITPSEDGMAEVFDFGSEIPTDAQGVVLAGASHYYDIVTLGNVEICFTLADGEAAYVFQGGTWVELAGGCWTGTATGLPFGVGGATAGGQVYTAPAFDAWDLVVFFTLAIVAMVAYLVTNPTNNKRRKK